MMGYITKQDFWLGTLYLNEDRQTWSMKIINAGLFSRNEYETISNGTYKFVECELKPKL